MFWISIVLVPLGYAISNPNRPAPWRLRLALQSVLPVWHTQLLCYGTVTHPHNNPSISRVLTGHLPKGHGGQHLSKNSPCASGNPVTRKAHKNKKDLITLLAQSEWMDCFCKQGEPRHHSLWVPISHLWRTTGHRVQFLFLSFLLVLKMPQRQKMAASRSTFQCTERCFNWCLRNKSQRET